MAGNELIRRLRSFDIQTLKTYRTELLGAAVLVAVTLLFNTYVYGHAKERIGGLKAEISGKETEILQLEAKSKAIAGLRRTVQDSGDKLHRVESRLASLKERLPSTSQISNLLYELSGEGSAEEVRIISIKPMASEQKGELVRLPFQVNMESAFFSFGDYIERLEKLERVMVIENFKIESTGTAAAEGSDKRYTLASQVYLSAYILGNGN